jgi:nicotinate dehydrogenase subunit B
MAQAPVRAESPRTELKFPFNVRPLLAGWNALFHQAETFQPDMTKSEVWNRGAYLVEGFGHCGSCHSPRNAFGAERQNAYLAGGMAEGWEAPPLTSLSQAPIPWSEDELFAYLRTGESRFHGVAAGPMAPVVREMTALPDDDIRAMAVYLASFNPGAVDRPAQQALATQLETSTQTTTAASAGARLYQGACAVCHEVGGAPLFGSRPSLALNSNLHSASPDNLIQIILHGIASPASSDLGYMPAFGDSLSDRQVADLAAYLRGQFAPGKPPWADPEAAIGRIRRAAVQ